MNEIIEKKATKILEEMKIDVFPVPVEKIAESLGIVISYAPSEEYSGILIRKKDGSGKVLVGINNTESRERQRFTIAHEIGHLVLHKNLNISIEYRMSYTAPKPQKEREADEFAGNLLMPKKSVTDDFKRIIQESSVFLENHLDELARKYAVSTEAMRIRLSILRLI